MNKKEYSVEIGGKTLSVEFNDLADQANGSAMVRYGNTMVFATAVMGKKPKDVDFFPLTVDYEEKFYAAGRILGGQFTRREGRPSDEAILSGRVVDRTIRPLFDQSMRRDVQVVITVLSIDEDDPDILAVLAASLSIGTSDIPWNGPVSAVRVGKSAVKDSLWLNPTYTERVGATLDLVACGKDGNINMIEVGAQQISNQEVVSALQFASTEIEKLQAFQKKIIGEIGKEKKVVTKAVIKEEASALFAKEMAPRLEEAVFSGPGKKKSAELKDEWLALYAEKFPEEKLGLGDAHFEEAVNDLIHRQAVEKGRRPDGRRPDEIRPLFVQAGGVSPMLHGTGIFYRGGTHVLSALTLGAPGDSQTIEGMELQMDKHFIHHYNFPPFSVGETGRMGGMNRRAIGHGNLAEKALSVVIPSREKFPYTIRLVSESMASNGSTSMGSVCASTVALMDGGVPINAPVAGIASGLMMKDHKNYLLLTDIQGPEDHHGDMDFKVAGTRAGITAVQMDVKVDGVPIKILGEAFAAAEKARLQIIDQIEKEIAAPRADISPKAPKIIAIKIKTDQIGLVIGSGGKTIKEIMEKTGAQIDIEDDGTVFFTGKEGAAEKAQEIVAEMTREYKSGDRFEGTVIKIMDFGAFVRIGTSAEGLVHISEIAPFRVDVVSKFLKEGQKVPVVVKEVDERGRIALSIKRVDPNFIKPPNPAS